MVPIVFGGLATFKCIAAPHSKVRFIVIVLNFFPALERFSTLTFFPYSLVDFRNFKYNYSRSEDKMFRANNMLIGSSFCKCKLYYLKENVNSFYIGFGC